MTYEKAEIRVLGQAAFAIRNFTKTLWVACIDTLTGQFGTLVQPAYDLDE